MTPSDVYTALGFPPACELGKRIFKTVFQKNALLSPSDNRVLSDDIESIVWQYTLKETTLPVRAYADEEREYFEIAALEVKIKSKGKALRVAELVHRAIPYPLLLVLCADEAVCLSMAHKRRSLAEKGAFVAEELLLSPWSSDEAETVDEAFLSSLALAELPCENFFVLYSALSERVLARMCAEISGQFVLRPDESAEDRHRKLDEVKTMANEIAAMKSAVKTEAGFAAKVDLNVRIKELEQKLAEKAAVL